MAAEAAREANTIGGGRPGCPARRWPPSGRDPIFATFRDRVRRFDFPPRTGCACELAETNDVDCFGNPHPVCGDCLWARGMIRCA